MISFQNLILQQHPEAPIRLLGWLLYKTYSEIKAIFENMQSDSKTPQKLVITAGKGFSDNLFSHQKTVNWKDIEALL